MARYEVHRTDGNAQQLRAYLEAHGAQVVVIDRPVDWVVNKYGLSVLAEVKTPDGKLNPDQMQFLSECLGWCVVLRTEEDCGQLLADMREAARRPDVSWLKRDVYPR